MEIPIEEFEVLDPVVYNGVRYEPGRDGDTRLIAMPAPAARHLVEIGAIRPARNDPPRADDPPPSPEGGGASGEPGPDAREDAIHDAIRALDRGDASLFTAAGPPTLAALRAAGAPADVTAAERESAWAAAG